MLDDKLREILESITIYDIDLGQSQVVKLIDQIKEVFRDSGYYQVWGDADATDQLLSGAEWYDRLMEEFLKVNRIYETPDKEDWLIKFTDFVEAAKKASEAR